MSIARRFSSRKWRNDIVIDPLSVNLHALVNRLYTTCVHLHGSPRIKGSLAPAAAFTIRTLGLRRGLFALSAELPIMVIASSKICPKSTSVVGRGAVTPSIFLFSHSASVMTSVTISSKRLAQPLTIPSWRCIGWEIGFSMMTPTRPIMPCKGLLNSWDIIAVRAFFRSCTSFISANSDRSCPMAMAPSRFFAESRLGTNIMASMRMSGRFFPPSDPALRVGMDSSSMG
mmetsp:Transcript_41501/g.72911  ORF Transcript_41501/g.72911 Transcript_41501/m.72911 type:complete len:229 (+) Transcript_41501:2170-2856(+)